MGTRLQSSVLPGGLRVITASMPARTSVSLGIWVGVGGRHEPASLNGAAHFIEHMLFKGTPQRSAEKISQDIEGLGGYLNAFTDEEHTCYYVRAGARHLPALFDVLGDMVLSSSFSPVEIRKEREVIKEEQAMYLDQPHHLVHEDLNAVLWPNHPLGRPLAGSNRSLNRLGRPELRGFLSRHYTAQSMLISAAGCLEHREVVKLAGSLAHHLPRGSAPDFERARPGALDPKRRFRLRTRPSEQTQIAMAVRLCDRHDPRRFALRILNTVLGENMSSRLFQVLREDRGLAYNVYSSMTTLEDTGSLTISAGVDTGKVEAVLRLVLKELGRLRQRRISLQELDRARDYLLGQMDLSLESTENHMMHLGEQIMAYRSVFSPDEIRRRLAATTREEVLAAARDFLTADRLHLAVVSPLREPGPLLRQLEKPGF